MLCIRKDGHRRHVTRRAFEAHWQRLGYVIVQDDTNDVKSLGDMTVAELRALAETRGIDLGEAQRKGDIIAALEAAAQ